LHEPDRLRWGAHLGDVRRLLAGLEVTEPLPVCRGTPVSPGSSVSHVAGDRGADSYKKHRAPRAKLRQDRAKEGRMQRMLTPGGGRWAAA
jgi:hypothetical protein